MAGRHTQRIVLSLGLVLFVCGDQPRAAEAPKPSPVQADLLADVKAIQPGQTFTLGVRLRMRPGWHTYWRNPGDAGQSTSVGFHLGEGFQVGRLNWPIPLRFDQPGDIAGFGYKESVLLTAKVKAPKNLLLGSTASLLAKVHWLACEKVCIPGSANVTLNLPVAKKAKRDNKKLFDQWQGKLPVCACSPDSPASALVKAQPSPSKKERLFHLQLDWKRQPRNVQIFPPAASGLLIDVVSSSTQGKKTDIDLKVRTLEQKKVDAKILHVLVVYEDKKGTRHGVRVPVAIDRVSEPKPCGQIERSCSCETG